MRDARRRRRPAADPRVRPSVVIGDRGDPDAIAAGLGEALARKDELGRAGREAAAAYDWARVAKETVGVYLEVAR